MTTITGLRSVELGVANLELSARFYSYIWGLSPISHTGDTVRFRGTSAEHHILTLRQRPKASLLGIHFAAADKTAVDKLLAKTKGLGVPIQDEPAALEQSAGGGYGFRFQTPDGHSISISSDVAHHAIATDTARPRKLSHVVLNSASTDREISFFLDVLGFRLSDSTDMMEFIRCGRDHHSVAVARSSGPSLNHMAYEMDDIDGLMLGSGRMRSRGFEIEWGVGRHGPGNNIFSYFIEPNGFVAEYTTGIEQVDETTYQPHTAEYWRNYPLRPCRWGMATQLSDRIKSAFDGRLPTVSDEETPLCDDVITRKFAG